jgi:hypothetical protein
MHFKIAKLKQYSDFKKITKKIPRLWLAGVSNYKIIRN